MYYLKTTTTKPDSRKELTKESNDGIDWELLDRNVPSTV